MSPQADASPGSASTRAFDLLVVGSGAAGLACATLAGQLGLKVAVLEKAHTFGGTTAWSGGWMFIPRNPLAVAAGINEPLDEVKRYLSAVGVDVATPGLAAFLAHGPAAVAHFQTKTSLQFVDGNQIPDFHGNLPGARTGGRSVCAAPFDAARLGEHAKRLASPRDLLSFMGLSIGGDLRHFMRAGRAWGSFRYVAGRLLRHGWECARLGYGRQRMGGNALAAALLHSALHAGVQLFESHEVMGLLTQADDGGAPGPAHHTSADQRITGALVRSPEGVIHSWQALRGVVLACGGFPHDGQRHQHWFAHVRGTGLPHRSAAPPSNTGDGLRMAQLVGGQAEPFARPMGVLPMDGLPTGAQPMSEQAMAARRAAQVDASSGAADGGGAWCPVSVVPAMHRSASSIANEKDGWHGHFPHLAERGKPGLIAVSRLGLRFVNEAGDYHSFMRALFSHCATHMPGQPVQAWLVVDHRFQRRYGLGHSKPWPLPTAAHRRSGYLVRANSLDELARRCGIDTAGLASTLAAYNHHARSTGQDPAFGRGSTPYQRMQGDAEHGGPNPCVAPISRGPFYAVRVVPGSLGTFAGLRTNEHAQVVACKGLYAVGNDMASVFGGHYPSGGSTLGPALTFAYIAAHHAAGQPLGS